MRKFILMCGVLAATALMCSGCYGAFAEAAAVAV